MNKSSLLRSIVLILAVSIVYLATVPGNQSEAEDAFWYALVAENSEAHWAHVHHMLYFPTIRTINNAMMLFGASGRAYPYLVLFHIVVGVCTVFIFYMFLKERMNISEFSAFAGSLLLAFSYGFWRYSVEVEIPVWASFVSIVLLYLGFCERYTLPRAFGLGAVAALAILFHGLNALLACTIIPVRLLVRSTIWHPVVYAVGAALVLISVYGAAFLSPEGLSIKGVLQRGTFLDPVYLLKGVIGFGQATISGNFLWGSAWFAERLQSLFVSLTMTEEIYMGAAAPKWLFYSSVISFLLMCMSSLWLVIERLRSHGKIAQNRDVIYIAVWCVIYVIFLCWFEGGNPELVVPALIPIWTLVSVFIIDVLYKNGKKIPCVAVVLFLFLHNLVGGFAWIWSEDGNYYHARSAWLLENVGDNDLIVAADKKGFTRYLRYWSDSEIVNVYNFSDGEFQAIEDKIAGWKGNVYVLEETIERPKYLCSGGTAFCDRLSAFAERLEPHLAEVANAGLSTVYKIK